MPKTRFPQNEVDAALRHLRRCDPVMRSTIAAVGPFDLELRTDRFGSLLRAILGQQISTKAAAAIFARVGEAVGGSTPSVEALHTLGTDGLRACGLSARKAEYVLDLCRHERDGLLDLRNIGRLGDEAIVERLTRVKGIGRWTAQMFLMFSLGRLDVLPHDDLGIRSGLRRLYELDDLPGRAVCERIAEPWRPYATIACWYVWRSLDATPA